MHPLVIYLGRWRYLLSGLLMIGFTIASIVITLSTLREEAIETHRNIAKLHAHTFEEHFTQTLQNIDYTMDHIPKLSDEQVAPQVLFDIFLDLLKRTPYLRSFSLVDREGFISVSSHQPNVGKRISMENFLPIPFADTPLLRIGIPWMGRDFEFAHPSNPQFPMPPESINFIPLLKKVFFGNKPYYLVATLNPDYFTNRYSQALPIKDGVVSLWRLDGILLFSTDNSLHVGLSHFNTTQLEIDNTEDLLTHLENNKHSPISAYRLARSMPFVIEVEMDQTIALHYWDQERNKILWINILFISLRTARTSSHLTQYP